MTVGMNRILYVEDDLLIAELAIMAMEDFGDLTIRHCTSGYEALEVVSEFEPDLILLDVMMPGMDGLETLQQLREIPGIARIPAVFISAKVQTHQQEIYIEHGACGVVAKPFDPLILSDTLRGFWEKATSGSQAPAPDHKPVG